METRNKNTGSHEALGQQKRQQLRPVGRMYDPDMSCFLSVDAYVQDPTSAQGFNRYAYCNYNPLRYTDPTGWVQRDGYSRQPNLNNNSIGHTTYYSDDPNDMLWGRTCHPCASGSKCNGEIVTSIGYTEGNEIEGNWYKDTDGAMWFDKNLKNQTQLKEGQTFCGTSFIQDELFYSMFGDVYNVNSISGKIVMKLELEVWPNWMEYSHQMDDFYKAWNDGEIEQYAQEPKQKTTDFEGIAKYNDKGKNCYSFQYGEAKVYFYVYEEGRAMNTNFRGWDDAGFSRNSDKTGRHETSGYDVHIRSWGSDNIKNAPHNGTYQSDVLKLVYPSYDSRKKAERKIHDKYY